MLLLALLDLSKAYDTVSRPLLLHKLKNLGVHSNMLQFLKHFLGERQATVRYRTATSNMHSFQNGVPQGSPLSPLLFNIYTAQALSDSGENVAAYADDLAVWTTAPTVAAAQRKLARLLAPVHSWASTHRMIFSSKKCKVLTITRKHVRRKPSVRFGPHKLVAVQEAKYLGIILDRQLTFHAHITDLAQRAKLTLNIIRKHSHTVRGCPQEVAIRMYTSILRPMLEYGSIVWGDASYTSLKLLDSIQHQALCRALAVNVKSHRSDVCVESHTPPLEVRRQIELLRYWRTIHTHTRPVTDFLDNFPEHDTLHRGTRKSYLQRFRILIHKLHITLADAHKLKKSDLNRHTNTLWHEAWCVTRLSNNDDRYKAYNLLHHAITFSLPAHYTSTPRATLSAWHMLRLSSAPLNDFLFSIKCSESSYCSCGRQAESVEHYLLHCTNYTTQRQSMFESIKHYFESDHLHERISSTMLLGNPLLMCDEWIDSIFLAVTRFIQDTKRFLS